MQLLSAFAIFFIIWWTVLFTVLPIGVRSQKEEKDVILGTESGAPTHAHMAKKLAITTMITCIIFGLFYYLTVVLGLGVANFPEFVPSFDD